MNQGSVRLCDCVVSGGKVRQKEDFTAVPFVWAGCCRAASR